MQHFALKDPGHERIHDNGALATKVHAAQHFARGGVESKVEVKKGMNRLVGRSN